jgi:hypothetical protein
MMRTRRLKKMVSIRKIKLTRPQPEFRLASVATQQGKSSKARRRAMLLRPREREEG